MKFIKKKILLVTCVVCLLPIISGVFFWNKLPEQMAIHFNINNVADNFASKWIVIFGFPVFMAVMQMACCIISDINEKRRGNAVKFERVSKWIIPAMSVIVYGMTVGYSLGYKLDIRRIVICLVGVIFVLLGNYMPKLNYIKNKDIPTDKAKKINRFVGILTFVMGIAAIVTIFFETLVSVIWLFCLIPYTIIGIVYGIKHGKSN